MAEGHHREGLVDGRHRGGRAGDLDAHRIGEVAVGHLLDGARHRGGEQGGAPLVGQGRGDLLDVLGEAHPQHLIGLVEHEVAHLTQLERTALDEVHDPPGGAHHDLRTALQGADLRDVGGAAVHGHHLDVARAAREVGDGVGRLQRELTGGGQHERLDGLEVRVDIGEEGQAERGGLARAGLGDADDVAPAQQHRDGGGLDVGRRREAEVLDGAQQVGRQAEAGEGGGVVGGGGGGAGLAGGGVGRGDVAVVGAVGVLHGGHGITVSHQGAGALVRPDRRR